MEAGWGHSICGCSLHCILMRVLVQYSCSCRNAALRCVYMCPCTYSLVLASFRVTFLTSHLPLQWVFHRTPGQRRRRGGRVRVGVTPGASRGLCCLSLGKWICPVSSLGQEGLPPLLAFPLKSYLGS